MAGSSIVSVASMNIIGCYFLVNILGLMMMSYATPFFPGMFIFGDSVVDVGNNNNLPTIVKANFPPYGRDFLNAKSTGRFSNGKLVTDFLAQQLRFDDYQVAYSSEEARVESNLLRGANFASAASGYYDPTANLNFAISLSKQLENYEEYQARVVQMVGEANASSIFSQGLHILSTGSSDFIQNYYINPLLKATYSTNQFFDIILRNYSAFITRLYGMGARRIGVTTLPPIGCVPAVITMFGLGRRDQCVESINYDAISFNRRLNLTSQTLRNRLQHLNLIVFDVYQPLYDLVNNPTDHGFTESRKGCCGTGLLETSVLCNVLSIGTCRNASEYVFWDAFHPSQAASQILADTLSAAGTSFIIPI